MNSTSKLIRVAEQLADRFERVGLDYSGSMDKADARLLDRVRKAIEVCRKELKTKPVGASYRASRFSSKITPR